MLCLQSYYNIPKNASLKIQLYTNKKNAEEIYSKYGLSLAYEGTVFTQRSCIIRGLLYDLRLLCPNAKTLSAMAEVEFANRYTSTRWHQDINELFRNLNTDE